MSLNALFCLHEDIKFTVIEESRNQLESDHFEKWLYWFFVINLVVDN